MKKILLLVVLALIGVAAWYFFETRQKPEVETQQTQALAVSQYSDTFNVSVQKMLDDYYAMSEAFVNWDSAAVTSHANQMQQSLENVAFGELQKDSMIYETAISYKEPFNKNIATIAGNNNLEQKRVAFNNLSQSMYDLLRTIRYDNQKVYVQQCPMAFNDTETGTWLSKEEEIRNPYLGKHHPKYKAGMLACGEVKETLDFASQR
ncbi:MAG: DUF3347 domain-containing protein [Chitinophagaceae bacterium]